MGLGDSIWNPRHGMTRPHRCPVCRGTGVKPPPYDKQDCQACKGGGYLWEPKEPQESTSGPIPGQLDLTYDGE